MLGIELSSLLIYIALASGIIAILLIFEMNRKIQQLTVSNLSSTDTSPFSDANPFVIDIDKNPNTLEAQPLATRESSELPDQQPHIDIVIPSKSTTFLLTHTDFDGLVSGALLTRSLGKGVVIRFSGPRNLHQRLNSLLQIAESNDYLFISDLGVSPDTLPEITRIIKGLHSHHIHIYWYDHHQWLGDAITQLKPYCEDLIVDVRFSSAAEIIRKRLFLNDPYADKLVSFIHNQTSGTDPAWDAQWRFFLSELQGSISNEARESAIHKLGFDQPLSIAEKFYVKRGKKSQELTQEIASLTHPLYITRRALRFIVIDVRTFRYEYTLEKRKLYVIQSTKPNMTVGRLACEAMKADFCLILWQNDRYSLYRGINQRIDFGNWLGERRLSGYVYRIAGHRYAAGVQTTLSFFHRMRLLLDWNTPKEVDALITALIDEF